MFVPHHFASSTWANHKEKGYSLKTFMLINTSGMDAQELLTAMRSTYNSFDTIEEGSACVFCQNHQAQKAKEARSVFGWTAITSRSTKKALKERSQPLLFGNLQFVLKVLDRMNSGVI